LRLKEEASGNTWWRGLDIRKGRIDDEYEMDISAGALIWVLNVILVVDLESC
jgi:hypothetical protein